MDKAVSRFNVLTLKKNVLTPEGLIQPVRCGGRVSVSNTSLHWRYLGNPFRQETPRSDKSDPRHCEGMGWALGWRLGGGGGTLKRGGRAVYPASAH